MSPPLHRLRKQVRLLQQIRSLMIFGVPSVLAVLWMVRVSEQFTILVPNTKAAIASGIFVFVIAFIPLVVVHTAIAAVLSQRLSDAERQNTVPRAIALLR